MVGRLGECVPAGVGQGGELAGLDGDLVSTRTLDDGAGGVEFGHPGVPAGAGQGGELAGLDGDLVSTRTLDDGAGGVEFDQQLASGLALDAA